MTCRRSLAALVTLKRWRLYIAPLCVPFFSYLSSFCVLPSFSPLSRALTQREERARRVYFLFSTAILYYYFLFYDSFVSIPFPMKERPKSLQKTTTAKRRLGSKLRMPWSGWRSWLWLAPPLPLFTSGELRFDHLVYSTEKIHAVFMNSKVLLPTLSGTICAFRFHMVSLLSF